MFSFNNNVEDLESLQNQYNELYLEDLAASIALKNISKQEESVKNFLTNNNVNFKKDAILETMMLMLSRSTNDNTILLERYLAVIDEKLSSKYSKEYANKTIKDIRYYLNSCPNIKLDDLLAFNSDADLIPLFNNIKDCANIMSSNSATLDELKSVVDERNILINANNLRNKAMVKLLSRINKCQNKTSMKR